ncbi:AP-4 complex accessory subunit tepsin [Eudromia elegans]
MAAPLRDRLSFLSRLPALLKGTADDDAPCPGYLLEDIARMSRESPGSSQCLLEYLLQRLRGGSCRVKLKVLKILLHTCARGSPRFLPQLRASAALVRDAAAFAGPPDPLHGNSLNQKVRAAAQELAALLFSDAPQPVPPPAQPLPPAGMGSQAIGSSQGFGFSRDMGGSGSAGEALLSGIQRAAEAVASAVLPPRDGPCHAPLHHDTYEPVRAPAPAGDAPRPAVTAAPRGARGSHRPGLPGGGWDEADGGSRGSSQGERSRASDSCSKSGSESPSGASRELASVAERVDADGAGDCVRERSLVGALTRGARVFLSREEAQHFVKECGLLNCDMVLELLGRALQDAGESGRMRALCALSSLLCSDLLAPEQILAATRPQLQQLSRGSPGPVADRATKMLRQFEALCGEQPPREPCGAAVASDAAPDAAPRAQDLLTEPPPLPARGLLEPVSAAPAPRASPAGTSPPAHSLGLFAGMELVAPPGAGLACPPAAPRTLCPAGDAGAAGGPSAFPFLNV